MKVWLKTNWAVEKYGDAPESFTLLHLASCFLASDLLLENLPRKEKVCLNNWKL